MAAQTFVYFMRCTGADRRVKVGWSTNPEKRLDALAAWSPWPLELVATIPGDVMTERRFHALFDHLHSHFEWFVADPLIEETIAAIQAGTFDVSTLPPPKMHPVGRPRRAAQGASGLRGS